MSAAGSGRSYIGATTTTTSTMADEGDRYRNVMALLQQLTQELRIGREWRDIEKRKAIEDLATEVYKQAKGIDSVESLLSSALVDESLPSKTSSPADEGDVNTVMLTVSCPAMSSSHTLQPVVNICSKWVVHHPKLMNMLVFLIIIGNVVALSPLIQESGDDAYIKYLLLIVCECSSLLLALGTFDLGIAKQVIPTFNFVYPMSLIVLYQIIECYKFHLLHKDTLIPLYLIKVPESIIVVFVVSLLILLDAAVHMKTVTKRVLIVGSACITVSLAGWLNYLAYDETHVMNLPENQFCYSFLFTGCASPLAIQSGIMKTVSIFYLKQLYHHVRHPSSFMMITKRVGYSVSHIPSSTPSRV